jgi:preprotein translocase subunit SecG
MLYGFLLTLYVILCLLLILIILIQKGKSSMGLGAMGGSSQLLFGGSGGQDLFQKITWVMITIFLSGSLVLALMKESVRNSFKYASQQAAPLPRPITDTESDFDMQRKVTIPIGEKKEASNPAEEIPAQ